MYVILIRENNAEGLAKALYDDAKDKGKDAVDYLEDSTSASYNNLKDAAQQITEEVIGIVTGILGGALDNLASSVYSLDVNI